MVHYKIILFLFALSFIAEISFAENLIDKGIYTIQNVEDNTYLKANNNGKLCQRRGDVISSISQEDGDGSRWKHEKGFGDGDILQNEDYTNNEITFDDIPPYCYLQYAEYAFDNIENDTFRIKNIRTNMCLTGAGDQQIIKWEECRSEDRSNQVWIFLKLE